VRRRIAAPSALHSLHILHKTSRLPRRTCSSRKRRAPQQSNTLTEACAAWEQRAHLVSGSGGDVECKHHASAAGQPGQRACAAEGGSAAKVEHRVYQSARHTEALRRGGGRGSSATTPAIACVGARLHKLAIKKAHGSRKSMRALSDWQSPVGAAAIAFCDPGHVRLHGAHAASHCFSMCNIAAGPLAA
jgi:hypothetical protein